MLEAAEIMQVPHATGGSEDDAAEELLPLIYAESKRLAAEKMAHDIAEQALYPTTLVHEVLLRLAIVIDDKRT